MRGRGGKVYERTHMPTLSIRMPSVELSLSMSDEHVPMSPKSFSIGDVQSRNENMYFDRGCLLEAY